MRRQGDTETRRQGDRVRLRVSLSPPLLVSLSCWIFFFGLYAECASAAELVPLEGAPVEAQLRAVDAGGLKLFGKAPITLPLDKFVRWGHPQPPRAQILVVLADGGRLVTAAAWAGGAAVRLVGDEVIALTDTWDEVRLPREMVS